MEDKEKIDIIFSSLHNIEQSLNTKIIMLENDNKNLHIENERLSTIIKDLVTNR